MKGDNENGKVSTDDSSRQGLAITSQRGGGPGDIRDGGGDRDRARGSESASRAEGAARPVGESAGPDYLASNAGGNWERYIDSIRRDATQIPPADPKCERLYPRLQECVRRVRDSKGRPRAGGEIKTVAKGSNYYSTLVMPEEGVQVSVVHNMLSTAWEALEQVLHSEPVPWVECSEFATRRAKQKGKAFQDKA